MSEVAPSAGARRWRIAVVSSHAIQYHVPLWRSLSEAPDLNVTVYLCSTWGVEEYPDPEFGLPVKWDVPLLSGYRHRLLRNWSPLRHSTGSFFGLVNPGIVAALRNERYDAVIIPGYATVSYWLSYLGAWLSDTPVFFRGEAVLRPGQPLLVRALKRALLTPLFRGTAAFLAIGSPSRAFYEAFGAPPERIFATPYTVDNDVFIKEAQRWLPRRHEIRAELGLDQDKPTFLFVGKLVGRKRPGDLLAAAARLEGGAQLLFVGDGALRSKLEDDARHILPIRTVFTGFRNQSELPRLYAAADALVLPSAHEVAPLVVNEAMCAGLGVVLSDAVPSVVDMVEVGTNGFCYPCGNVDALGSILHRLATEPGLLDRLGAASRERVRSFSHARVLDGLREALVAIRTAHRC